MWREAGCFTDLSEEDFDCKHKLNSLLFQEEGLSDRGEIIFRVIARISGRFCIKHKADVLHSIIISGKNLKEEDGTVFLPIYMTGLIGRIQQSK